mmetsp:Transcript_46609/g.72952  ORF Transcript_46609/g.72952 Transcript_46609/m.72952 type:complete len:692 (+) Transcript_46609:401-2476(+)|eukprot:CAMPEP_0184327604 /NCGR_PEP_ID=MMETSP1049-20130417/143180_1 /TAXON_ID=77928 /ORGANISM="Proteomonas sulcata, Strain CCMP704" /LENGTH=691 /DNA_ID=CAMNT_0026649867 /DNA_START=428 /DNA_END=2503 /DNA_ORIENTATION=-
MARAGFSGMRRSGAEMLGMALLLVSLGVSCGMDDALSYKSLVLGSLESGEKATGRVSRSSCHNYFLNVSALGYNLVVDLNTSSSSLFLLVKASPILRHSLEDEHNYANYYQFKKQGDHHGVVVKSEHLTPGRWYVGVCNYVQDAPFFDERRSGSSKKDTATDYAEYSVIATLNRTTSGVHEVEQKGCGLECQQQEKEARILLHEATAPELSRENTRNQMLDSEMPMSSRTRRTAERSTPAPSTAQRTESSYRKETHMPAESEALEESGRQALFWAVRAETLQKELDKTKDEVAAIRQEIAGSSHSFCQAPPVTRQPEESSGKDCPRCERSCQTSTIVGALLGAAVVGSMWVLSQKTSKDPFSSLFSLLGSSGHTDGDIKPRQPKHLVHATEADPHHPSKTPSGPTDNVPDPTLIARLHQISSLEQELEDTRTRQMQLERDADMWRQEAEHADRKMSKMARERAAAEKAAEIMEEEMIEARQRLKVLSDSPPRPAPISIVQADIQDRSEIKSSFGATPGTGSSTGSPNTGNAFGERYFGGFSHSQPSCVMGGLLATPPNATRTESSGSSKTGLDPNLSTSAFFMTPGSLDLESSSLLGELEGTERPADSILGDLSWSGPSIGSGMVSSMSCSSNMSCLDTASEDSGGPTTRARGRRGGQRRKKGQSETPGRRDTQAATDDLATSMALAALDE